jgi:hypothetical protein
MVARRPDTSIAGLAASRPCNAGLMSIRRRFMATGNSMRRQVGALMISSVVAVGAYVISSTAKAEDDASRFSQRHYSSDLPASPCGGEGGVVRALAAWRVTEGDWASVWQPLPSMPGVSGTLQFLRNVTRLTKFSRGTDYSPYAPNLAFGINARASYLRAGRPLQAL